MAATAMRVHLLRRRAMIVERHGVTPYQVALALVAGPGPRPCLRSRDRIGRPRQGECGGRRPPYCWRSRR